MIIDGYTRYFVRSSVPEAVFSSTVFFPPTACSPTAQRAPSTINRFPAKYHPVERRIGFLLDFLHDGQTGKKCTLWCTPLDDCDRPL
jgi:hypothetical protein